MSSWNDYYQNRLMTAEQAMARIKSHDVVIDGFGFGRTEIFYPALLNRADELEQVKMVCGFHAGKAPYCAPEYESSFTVHSIFNTKPIRSAYQTGCADYIPMPFSQFERYGETLKPDVLLTQVTPPDENGMVSMGIDVDYTRAMVDCAKLVIAHVNPNMPWLGGDAVIPVEKIHCFVEADTPLQELNSPAIPGEAERKIAGYVAPLIHDGDTLQIGVGAIPDQVLKLLSDRQHLGVHTELGTPSLMPLMKAGVIDNSQKTLDAGYSVCTLIGGSKEFYEYLHHNPQVMMKKSSYVTNPMVIAQQDNICCINAALQIDLYGQVAADMLGEKQFSGVGGQLDFLRGAAMAKNGRSVICMPSTAANGTVSRIVPFLDHGAAVTDSRYDVMYVATEYGIANLWGKSVKERAEALIQIAHPKFREKLSRQFFDTVFLHS